MKEHRVILAIDDEESLLKLIRANLGAEGYEVVTCTRGSQAPALIAEKKPSLVLLDVMMPEMDGFSTLRLIREHSDVPVIMLTAHDDPDTLSKAMQTGADDFISKPFSIRELTARVKAKIRRSPESEG